MNQQDAVNANLAAGGVQEIPALLLQAIQQMTAQMRMVAVDERRGQPFYNLHESSPLTGKEGEDVSKWF